MAEFMDLETFSPNWELILGVGDIMSCCIGLQNTLIVPTETSNIWLVGINTILTPILGKQVNIHPLGECIHRFARLTAREISCILFPAG